MFTSVWDFLGRFGMYVLLLAPTLLMVYCIGRLLSNTRHTMRGLLLFTVITLVMLLFFFVSGNLLLAATPANLIVSILCFACTYYFVYGLHGWRCVLGVFQLFVLLTVMELLCAPLSSLLIVLRLESGFHVFGIQDFYDPTRMLVFFIQNTLSIGLVLIFVIIWKLFKYRMKDHTANTANKRWLYAFSFLRLFFLMVASVGALSFPYSLFRNQTASYGMNASQHVIMSLSAIGLAAIAFSYFAQDIRYIMQLQRLNSLEQQQAISRSLLQNLRFFRHNMVNMLYGLEGVLIGGDRDKVIDYYQQMREKCALVNNENIAALERITNPSVGAVLLNSMDRARQLNLPINLYVQEKVFLGNALKDTDLCQVLGVLLDNAIEAADAAGERFVSIAMRNVDDAVEIIIKNTYSGEISLEQLTYGGDSTKEGHAGHGLQSCYHILSRRKGAFLNFWVTGQYVQTQLLLER